MCLTPYKILLNSSQDQCGQQVTNTVPQTAEVSYGKTRNLRQALMARSRNLSLIPALLDGWFQFWGHGVNLIIITHRGNQT